LASLRNAKNMVELLRHQRPNDTPPRLVINQVGIAKRPEIPAKDFAETLGLEPALVMPFDPQLFGQAANNGQMLNEVAPKSPTADGVRRLAQIVTGRTPQPAQKAAATAPFLSFLTGKKRA
jgi:pilus assembly protein CpaE